MNEHGEGPSPTTDVLGRRVRAGEIPLGEFTYSVVELKAPTRPQRPAEASQRTTGIARPPAADDRRGGKRQATRLRDAQVEEQRGRVLVDCRIKDLSQTGARLALHAEAALPKSFVLCDSANHVRFTATLAWQRGRDAGVKLTPIPQR